MTNASAQNQAKSPAAFLRCEHLGFRYDAEDAQPAFTDISLSVGRGEAVLLMGPSGGGKSTLAYCLAGLYPEYAGKMEGEIFLNGRSLSSYGPAERARKVSILFQNPDNQFCMDRVDNEVLFALENINYQGDLRARTRELLKFVGLETSEHALIRTLSGGMKQKLALCTALATGAEMLILDEPFANLDPLSCRQLAEELERLNRAGMTMLIVDHKPGWWKPFISRIVFMEKSGDLDAGSISPAELEAHAEEFRTRGLFTDDSWLSEETPAPVPAPAGPMVETEDLSLLYGKNEVFMDHISFCLEKGSVTSLVGECGSGKTTLLQTICGIGKHGGTLRVNGRAGLVFQNPRFQFLKLTVLEEVMESLRMSHPGKKDEELLPEARELLKDFGLSELAANSPYAISQGQQRRLALLSMLACDCPLMLLDEPTYAQDERSTRFILELLKKQIRKGLTVIMATHDLALAKALSNHIFLLDGKSVRALSAAETERYLAERREPA